MIDIAKPKPLTIVLTSTTCTCKLTVSAYPDCGSLSSLEIRQDYCPACQEGKKLMPEVRDAIRIVNAWQRLARSLTKCKRVGESNMRKVLFDTTGFEFIEDRQAEGVVQS